jgi:hypothetical protein
MNTSISYHFRGFCLLVLLAILAPYTHAQHHVDQKQMLYADQVYEANIATVQLRPISDPFGLPILRFGGADQLRLDFDDLSPDFTNYGYTLIHCTHDWQPSDLLKAEYLEGLQDYYIENYEFSLNTYIPYTHYWLTIPNNTIKISKSGNYVLVVYKNNNPEDVVLTRRFMVYENVVTVTADVIRATRLEERDTHQQLNFTLTHIGYDIPNPFFDLYVNVVQNGRWDNARIDIKPKFIKNQQIDYNFEGENTFYGGNEFRNFDTKQLTELTLNTRKTVLDSNYTVYLVPETPRLATRYSFNEDINGRFVIRRLNSTTPETEADYAWFDFYLASDPIEEGDVYVFGQLSDWRINPRFKLQYDPQTKAYRGKILLKQGYYNYQYVVVNEATQLADETQIEGSHWETSNEYTILVYHREIGIRYDRLIGINKFMQRPVQR